MKKFFKKQKGFTLIELMVSVAIFVFMTAFLLAKYGTFNQSVLLTNLAYDVALTIRTAQSYGLNVKSVKVNGQDNQFNYPYGVDFIKGATQFTFFSDNDGDRLYDSGESISSPINIKRGASIKSLCVGNGNSCTLVDGPLDITFKRPDPDAIIRANGDGNTVYTYAEITLQSTDGSTRKVSVRSTGQIAVI